MTDPMNAPPMQPTTPPMQPTTPPAAPPPSVATSPMSGMLASMSRAELFIAGGAALILVTDLIFTVFGAYGSTNIVWAAAAVALILVVTHKMATMSLSDSTYRALLLVTGLVALLAGIRDLLYDVQYFPGRSVDVTYMLGALGLYVGVALMALGAWQLWSRRSA